MPSEYIEENNCDSLQINSSDAFCDPSAARLRKSGMSPQSARLRPKGSRDSPRRGFTGRTHTWGTPSNRGLRRATRRRDPYPGYPLKPRVAARDPASGASGSGEEASPHSLGPAPYSTRCRNRFDLLRFLASLHGGKMNQKGGPTNTKHCFHECSAWPGIHVHHAAESVFTFSGIRTLRF